MKTHLEQVYHGIPVSPGIAIGRCFVMRAFGGGAVEPRDVADTGVDIEIERFMLAVQVAKDQLRKIHDQVAQAIDEKHADIFLAQAEFLNDPELIDKTVEAIRNEQKCAEYLFDRRVKSFMEVLSQLEDESFKARNSDLLDVANRVLKNLGPVCEINYETLRPNTILVGSDLAPSETTNLLRQKVAGMVLEKGGATSHTAIMAKALEIPSVVGVSGIMAHAQHWDTFIVDGQRGRIIINPLPETIAQYEEEQKQYAEWDRELETLHDLPAETKDGYSVILRANVELVEEADHVLKHGACGIGLFRTEFLFMNRDTAPAEDEQYEIYTSVLKKVGSEPVTFRTLDFGGDKFLTGAQSSRELNPFMGLRAVRLCLSNPSIFRAQIRAMLRASAHGKAKILIPMVSGYDEFLEVKRHIRRAKAELRMEGIPFDRKVPVGAMIEVPSAAVNAVELAQECDFFSIGTNDLIQYTLAVDRGNEQVAYLYEPFHPAVLRLIKQTVQAARKAGICITVCGEMASDPVTAVVLLGMGVDELSMSAISIPHVKRMIRAIDLAEARVLAEELLMEPSISGIQKILKKRMKQYVQLEGIRRIPALKA